MGLVWLVLIGCGEPEAPPKLGLDGPARVRVEALGPVEGPHAVLPDGSRAENVHWEAAPDSVAIVEGDHVEAVGPGEATISGTWQKQSVEWTLVVEPAITIVLVDPPPYVGVGETVPLQVAAKLDGKPVEARELEFSSSDPGIATVNDKGEVTGKAPGIAYVTVTSGRSQAMLEVDVK